MMKALLRTFVVLAALLALIIILLLSPLGLKITLETAKHVLPGSLRYHNARGLLTGPINIEDISYQNNDLKLHVQDFKLHWNLWALFTKTLDIHHLSIKKLRINVLAAKQPSPQTSTNSKFGLPLNIKIKSAEIHKLVITTPNELDSYAYSAVKLTTNLSNKSYLSLQATQQQPYPLQFNLQMHGKWQNYTFKLHTNSNYGTGIITGSGNTQGIKANSDHFKSLGGTLSMQANIQWLPYWQWQAKINANAINLRVLLPQAPKAADINIDSKGQYHNNLTLTLLAKLHADTNQLQLTLRHQQQWSGSWQLHINQLDKYINATADSITSSGTFAGKLKTPNISATLQAKNLRYQKFFAHQLKLSVDLNLSQRSFSKLIVDGHMLRWQHLHIKQLSINAHGNQQTQTVDLAFNNQFMAFSSNFSSQILANNQYTLKLNTLNLTYAKQRWALTKPADLTVTPENAIFTGLCLKANQQHSLCLQGNWHANAPWQASMQAQKIPAELITRFISPNIKLTSTIGINATVTGKAADIKQANLDVTLSNGNVTILTGDQQLSTQFLAGKFNAKLNEQGLQTHTDIRLNQHDNAQAQLNLPGYLMRGAPNKHKKITGLVTFNLRDIKQYIKNIPYIDLKQGGYLQSKINIAGTLEKPTFHGNGILKGAVIRIPLLNITLQRFMLDAQSQGTVVNLSATAYSNGRPLIAKANIHLHKKDLPIHVEITGNNVLVANTSEFKIWASPNLTAKIKGNTIDISGSILIPKAKLSPQDFENVVTLPTNDMVYIGKRDIVAGKDKTQINAKVNIKLGDNVNIDFYGLTGKLTGGVTVNSNKKGTFGNGRIYVSNGVFEALGQKLIIDKNSSLFFTDTPIANPSLDVRAFKQLQAVSTGAFQQTMSGEIKVGVQITGDVNKPIITFYSNPGIYSQVQILSYLLFGYAGTGGGKISNVSLLLGAVNALKLGGGNANQTGIINQLRDSLGFSEFGIESQSILDAADNPIDTQTAFVIGKYFTKWLYIRYSMAIDSTINQRINILQAQILLGIHWMLQGTVNTNFSDSTSANLTYLGDGIDLFYRTSSKD